VPRSLRLAPRAGIAWSLPSIKTVVRAGVGIYPSQAAYSIFTNFVQNLRLLRYEECEFGGGRALAFLYD